MPRLDDDAVKALEAKHGALLVIHISEGADETLAFKAAAAAQDLTVQQWAWRLLFPAAGLPAASRPVRGKRPVQP